MRSPRLTLALWALAAAILLPRAAGLEDRLEVGARISGSGSAAVEEELATRFHSPFAQFAVLVVTDAPPPATPEGQALLGTLTKHIGGIEGVLGVHGYETASDSLLLGSDGRTSLMIVGLDAHLPPDATLARLRAATAGSSGATLRWTGQAPLNADLRRMSADDAALAERRVLPLTLLLLLFAFGSFTAAALPVLAGALTVGLVYGAAAWIAGRWPLAIALQNVASMIGLGLGIDYALLSVSRFRESRDRGASSADAAADTVRHAGHTIALSGLAVAVGFAGLLAIPVSELRSVGVGGLLTVIAAVLIAVSLLPIVLVRAGDRVRPWRILGSRSASAGSARWRRWGEWVARHPIRVLAVAGAPVLLLAWQSHRLVVGEPSGDWMPPRMESALALRDLRRVGRSAPLQTIRVVLELPAGSGVSTAAGWRAAGLLHARLTSDPRVALVRSIVRPDGAQFISRELVAFVPGDVVRSLVSPDGGALLYDVIPRENASVDTLTALARELRRLDVASLTGLTGASLGVGGLPAFRADYLDSVGHALPLVVLLIVAGTTLALAIGFRSLLVPLKAVVLNLLSVAAGFGALVLVFQDGHLLGLFGIDAPVDQVFVAIPPLVFCAVFGLSMDYEVFLVARVREARRAGLGEAAAIADALARTAPVITNAAAVMIVVFGAFALGNFLMMRMLGLALAVTVLVDAAIVRTAIGPALLALAGRWNWWPGER